MAGGKFVVIFNYQAMKICVKVHIKIFLEICMIQHLNIGPVYLIIYPGSPLFPN